MLVNQLRNNINEISQTGSNDTSWVGQCVDYNKHLVVEGLGNSEVLEQKLISISDLRLRYLTLIRSTETLH